MITNITPDHLDRYDNRFENYVAAKFRITENQDDTGFFIYDADDETIVNGLSQYPINSRPLPFSLKSKLEEGAYEKNGEIQIRALNNTMTMSFDMPLADTKDTEEDKENVITFNLDEEVTEIDVNDHIEVVPILEYNKDGETRYSLDDYMELENKLTGARSKAEEFDPKIVENELVFEKKTLFTDEGNQVPRNPSKEIDPMESGYRYDTSFGKRTFAEHLGGK